MFSNRKQDLSGLIVITPSRYGDHRGFFAETYNQRDYTKLGVDIAFVQDNHSGTSKNCPARVVAV